MTTNEITYKINNLGREMLENLGYAAEIAATESELREWFIGAENGVTDLDFVVSVRDAFGTPYRTISILGMDVASSH